MENNEKQKNNELIALRFKEIRNNYFHSGVMKNGKKSDHTQDDFGEFLGVDGATIRNYEKGRTPIPYKHLRKLSDEYGILIEYLLGESNFHTLKEKRAAIEEEKWEKQIVTPAEIDHLVGEILKKMGYEEFEDDITGKEFFTADFEIPANYTSHQRIPDEDIRKSFDNGYRNIRPQVYRGIKREKDGKAKYILNSRLNAVFDDIENYIKYRIEREFR